MSDRLPVISLWQPWAQWVALGWKTIETRMHSRFACLAGKRIGIHVARKWDRNAMSSAQAYLTNEQCLIAWKTEQSMRLLAGNVICTAWVRRHRRLISEDSQRALIECNTTRFGLILQDIVRIDSIPMRGVQGICYIPFDFQSDLLAAIHDREAHYPARAAFLRA